MSIVSRKYRLTRFVFEENLVHFVCKKVFTASDYIQAADLFICTSPFVMLQGCEICYIYRNIEFISCFLINQVICSVFHSLYPRPTIAYLGLPLLWKRPSDHFSNEQFCTVMYKESKLNHNIIEIYDFDKRSTNKCCKIIDFVSI